jgi:hypothetical protein
VLTHSATEWLIFGTMGQNLDINPLLPPLKIVVLGNTCNIAAIVSPHLKYTSAEI